RGSGLSGGWPHPLDGQELLRNSGARLPGLVERHRQQEGMIVRHVECSLDRYPPLAPKVAFGPGLGLCRNQRHEVIAFANLLADLLIPRLSPAELALVVPNLA